MNTFKVLQKEEDEMRSTYTCSLKFIKNQTSFSKSWFIGILKVKSLLSLKKSTLVNIVEVVLKMLLSMQKSVMICQEWYFLKTVLLIVMDMLWH